MTIPLSSPQDTASTTRPDGIGLTIGFAAGIFTAAGLAAAGWFLVYLTMHRVGPWVAAMVVLALVYVALLLVDRTFPPGRVHCRAVRPIVRTLTEGTKGD